MGKYCWVTWIKVLALTAVFAVVIVLGYRQVKKSVADYLVDAPADAKLTDKLNLEDMVFDYAGEFVDRMILQNDPHRGRNSAPGVFDCQRTCPAENYGGKDRVKGNRQGVLSRSITRRSGRIAKA